MEVFNYGSDHLTTSIALKIARGQMEGILSSETKDRVLQSAQYVQEITKKETTVYGINTGFGPLCTTKISAEDTETLQYNILKSQSGGV